MSLSADNVRERFDNNVDYIIKCYNQALQNAGEVTPTFSKDNLIAVYQAAASLTIAETIEERIRKNI